MITTKTKLIFTALIHIFIIFSQLGKISARNTGPTDTAIGCFVCSSRNGSNPYCEDPFHPGMLNDTYQEKCKVPKRNHIGEFPAHFCIKVIGTSYGSNEKVVVRRCSITTMENQCGNFQIENDLMRGCVLTCGLDGCNKAGPLHPFGNLTIISFLISSFVFTRYYFNGFEFGWFEFQHKLKLR